MRDTSLVVYAGSMGSGKTSKLMRKARMWAAAGYPIICIVHALDSTRHGGRNTKCVIETHDGARWPAVRAERLMDVINMKEYRRARYVLIDEGQFFLDLIEFIDLSRKTNGKHLVVAGLDSDSEGRAFMPLSELVTRSTKFTKLAGICRFCGGAAGHTISTVKKTGRIMAAGLEAYAPTCYACFLDPNRRSTKIRRVSDGPPQIENAETKKSRVSARRCNSAIVGIFVLCVVATIQVAIVKYATSAL
jgi:thymidine kinase